MATSTTTTTTGASTTVGWDTSLAGQSWSSPMGSGADGSTAGAADADGLIQRTKEIKVDANDYSRFKNIGDNESDDENVTGKGNADVNANGGASAGDSCRNCHKSGAKLKCSVCKKAAYCARACQASDWTFHKRICKKPEEKKASEPPKRPAPTKKPSESSSSSKPTTKSTSSTKPKSSTTATNSSSSSTEVVLDEPDLPSGELRGYKNGLPYFHRELSEKEQDLIGDIAPKKVEVAPEAAVSTEHQGSAWNAAGTFEERNFTKWAEQKWKELYADKTYSEGDYAVTFGAPEKLTGDASICVVRGKKRFLFDFCFKLPFEVMLGGNKYKGSYQMNEISNDEDYEITAKLSKKPQDITQATALQKFISTRSSGLQKEVLRIVGLFITEFQGL